MKELGEVFEGSELNWHMDGALNISLMNGKYIGYHKDVDLSVEENELNKLESHLLKKGYGLFLSRTEDKNKNKVMRRVGHENFRDSKTEHMLIAAIDETGKIRRDRALNFVDVHIIKRSPEGKLLSDASVVMPEKWGRSYPVEFQGHEINLSHPGKVLYFKIHQGRNYDATDIQRLIDTGKITQEDMDKVSEILESEFIENRKRAKEALNEISKNLKSKATADEIFSAIANHPVFKGGVESQRDAFQGFAQKIAEGRDNSGEHMYEVALEFFDADSRDEKTREKFKEAKSYFEDYQNIKSVREKIENYSPDKK
jgi:hypothetical protein